jgi:hypothetical protein
VPASELLSSPGFKNISVFRKIESAVSFAHPASLAEGRIAIVTTREAGMRWTRMCLLTSGADADGKIVWSWRAHAGAKFLADSSKASHMIRLTEEREITPYVWVHPDEER